MSGSSASLQAVSAHPGSAAGLAVASAPSAVAPVAAVTDGDAEAVAGCAALVQELGAPRRTTEVEALAAVPFGAAFEPAHPC